MTFTIQLTNVDSAYQYKLLLKFAQTYRPQTEKQVTPVSAPGIVPEDANLMQFQGMTMRFRIEGMLYDDGTDISDGTAPSDPFGTNGVVDIDEQVKWINFYIHRQGIGVRWNITGPGLPTGGVNTALERASARRTADRPHEGEITLVMTAGDVIG